MVKYTPGPWRAQEATLSFAAGVYGPRIFGEDRNWVADTSVGEKSQQKANASLIAAAPEMLVALQAAQQELLSLSGSTAATKRLVRDAIIKAEGD